MRDLGQEEASKHCGATETNPARKAVPPPEKVTTHLAGTRPEQCGERGRMAAQLLAGGHHVTGFIPNASCPLKPAMLWGRSHRGPRDLDTRLPQPSSLCSWARACFIFFASFCPGFGGPLAPHPVEMAKPRATHTPPLPAVTCSSPFPSTLKIVFFTCSHPFFFDYFISDFISLS